MVPGFSKQHLCNRDLTKIRVPEIRGHYPQDSRLPNPYLAKVRGKQRASQPLHDTRKTPPHRGAGYAIVPEPPSRNVTRFAQWRYRAPSGRASRSIFSATREAAGVRAAWSPPFQSPPYDHADRATLGRRDAKASRRPRRPVLRAWSGTTAATGTGAVSVSVGDRTNPRRYTPSPAGRRRYKHRSAPCSAHVSWAMEPTRIGTPPGGPMRSAVPDTGQAAGVPSAWSQPFQSTHE